MDKLAEQINRDIYTLAMYKLANWSKIAEGETVPPPSPPQQEPEPYPTNIREMDPRRTAEAMNFEQNVYRPIVGNPDEYRGLKTKSPVTGGYQSMPQRYADTAMGLASGINLPIPTNHHASDFVTNMIDTPYAWQAQEDLRLNPDREDFYRQVRSNMDDIEANNSNYFVKNPGRLLRKEQGFSPR